MVNRVLTALICLAVPLSVMTGCKQDSVLIKNLPSNPTTGYDWQFVESDEVSDGQVQVDIVFESNDVTGKLVGASGIDHIQFTGLKAGTAVVTLAYVRAWEFSGDITEAEGLAVYELQVNRNLSVELVSASIHLPPAFRNFDLD